MLMTIINQLRTGLWRKGQQKTLPRGVDFPACRGTRWRNDLVADLRRVGSDMLGTNIDFLEHVRILLRLPEKGLSR